MAAAAHVTVLVYGEIEGQPPYQDKNGATAFSRVKAYPTPANLSLPTTGTIFTGLPNGTLVGNNYVYSVIEVQPTGLTPPHQSTKYATAVSLATLATNAG